MSSGLKVVYLAAHGGFAAQPVPLGGGAAIFNLLTAEWSRTAPFVVETVTPSILGANAPSAADIASFNERDYAEFCCLFREACTRRVLEEDPASVRVLVNDVSEGPDFKRLALKGYRLTTIFHVDVVAYIARIYLRGWVAPWTLARFWHFAEKAGVAQISPTILRLIFDQQAASVAFSSRVVVPSEGMRDTIHRCYPGIADGKVTVLPWGTPPSDVSEPVSAEERARLRTQLGIPQGAFVLLTLSRISPEKGHDLLLRACLEWEAKGGPDRPVWLLICGEKAYMQGERFMAELKRLAAKLERIKVVFAGYVTGSVKGGYLSLADLYVFPSRHESYGLTLMEAMSAGLPCIALEHDGSRQSMSEQCGVLIRNNDSRGAVSALWREIDRLCRDEPRLSSMGTAAAAHAAAHPFKAAAERLARVLPQ